MSFKFASHNLLNGLFEPEGIYLAPPLDGPLVVLQGWGAHPAVYGASFFNGVPLKGHVGIDIAAPHDARLLAADAGRVVELGFERGGFERYIKLEHRWGESFYAHVGEPLVESGQMVQRGDALAGVAAPSPSASADAGDVQGWFHFGVRVAPFNRYDGWGGFTDPTPFLPPGRLVMPNDAGGGAGDLPAPPFPPHPMVDERQGIRRP